MTRFDNFFVGFDAFDHLMPTSDYPRYNILKVNGGYEVHIALPGWEASNIDAVLHKGILKVKGEKQTYGDDVQWIHRGISGKSFERVFKLDTDLEVKTANFLNGMLIIRLEYASGGQPIKIEIANKEQKLLCA